MDDIPLRPIKSNSSTGARKPGDAALYETTSAGTGEKSGLFHRNKSARVAGGKRKLKNTDENPKRVDADGQEISVNGLGRLYNKIVNFSVVTRYMGRLLDESHYVLMEELQAPKYIYIYWWGV